MSGFNKFLVIKGEDIRRSLSSFNKYCLEKILEEIRDGRIADQKPLDNKYIVINQDEPYADEVIEILKRNGHWG